MKLEDEIVQTTFKSEQHKLLLNIFFTNNWLVAQLEKNLGEKGLTGQQYNILRILRGQHPKPASVNLLRERMLDKMSDVSRLVERLRVKGLVTRKECAEDRRQADVLISAKGLSLLKEFDKKEKSELKLMETLSDKEAKVMNEMLDKLRG